MLNDWLSVHYVEVLGAVLGLAYIFLSIRQNILTWPVGLSASLLYIVVFYGAGFYAGMALQAYYAGMSIYGWYYWLKGGSREGKRLPVTSTPSRLLPVLAGVALALFMILVWMLRSFTDSLVPYLDASTTALSVVATWMLARKYLETWMIWIIADSLSIVLYVTRDLWPTVALFSVYVVMAVAGYRRWLQEKRESFR